MKKNYSLKYYQLYLLFKKLRLCGFIYLTQSNINFYIDILHDRSRAKKRWPFKAYLTIWKTLLPKCAH